MTLAPTNVGFLKRTVPESTPMFNVAATPNAFTVVAVVLYTFCVVSVPTNVGLRNVAVPELAPMFNVLAALPKLIVVATEL